MNTEQFNNLQDAKLKRMKDLSIHLKISKATLWKWVKEGKIQSIKVSERVTLFNVAEVEKALFGAAL
jgi:predicted site-specific integrase-resolvase